MAERVPFRDGYTCECVVKSLPLVEADMLRRGLIKSHIDIYKYSYIPNDFQTDSKGTHAGGGVLDVGQYSPSQIDVWRQWGWTMQDRSPYFAQDHGHGWPYKCPHLSPAAQAQEDDWDRKDAGLQGTAQVQGRWPILPWYEALELHNSKLGVPLMANAVPIKITYHDDQPLDPAGHVYINANKDASLVVGSSAGIDVTATVEVDGLQPGEYAEIWWRKVWRKAGEPDQNKGNDLHATIVPIPDKTVGTAQVRFADELRKADTGWTACLRLRYATNSQTAVIVRRQFRGWRLEA